MIWYLYLTIKTTRIMKKLETLFIIAGVVVILVIGVAFLMEVAKFNPNIFGI